MEAPLKSPTKSQIEIFTYCIYLVGFLDLFGVSIVIPLLPTHIQNLGASPALNGLIGSVYGAIQLFSGPLIGKWSDVVDRQQVLLKCLAFSALGYLTLGLAPSLLVLVLGRAILGVFKHSTSIAKAYLADISPEESRPTVFGRFNAACSLAFIVGPAIGGHLAVWEGGLHRVFYVAAAVFILNYALVLYIKNHIPQSFAEKWEERRRREIGGGEASSLGLSPGASLSAVVATFRHIGRTELDLFAIRFCLGFATMLYRTNFILMLENRYQTTAVTNGYVISYSAAVGALGSLAAGRCCALYRHQHLRLLLHASLLLTLTLALLTFAPSLEVLVVSLSLLSLATSVSKVCVTEVSVRRGHQLETGAMVGMSQSVMSIARMVSPTLGGLAQEMSFQGPGVLSILFAVTGSMLVVMAQTGGVKDVKQKSQ